VQDWEWLLFNKETKSLAKNLEDGQQGYCSNTRDWVLVLRVRKESVVLAKPKAETTSMVQSN